MGVHPIAGVDHGDPVQPPRQKVGGPGVGMAHHNGVHAHRLQGQPGVQQRLALFHAAARGGNVDNVGAQNFPRFFKRNPCPGAGLIEQGHYYPAPQRRHLLDVPFQHLGHSLGRLQHILNFRWREVVQVQHMAARRPPGGVSGVNRSASRGVDRFRQAHATPFCSRRLDGHDGGHRGRC